MTFKRCFLALACVSSGALAQADGDNLLGAAERSRPQYDGSDRQTTDAIPLIRYARGPWFVRTLPGILEGGGHLRVAGGMLAGLQLAHEAGPLDGDPGASLGAHVEWTTRIGRAPLNALARIRQHLDADRGRQLDARLTLGVYGSAEVRAGVFGGATWASEKHLLAYYDVPGSGLQYTSAGALGSYKLSRSWLAVATAELRRLADKPSQSIFVQERTNAYMNLGVAYRF